MAALDFLKNSHNVRAIHFNHKTSFADKAERVVVEYCNKHKIPLDIGRLGDYDCEGRSMEDFWREHRYKFFEQVNNGLKVITCHHLDDVVETWLFGSISSREVAT